MEKKIMSTGVMNDHDLLITLHTKVEMILGAMDKIENNTVRRLTALEQSKADACDIADLQKARIKKWSVTDKRLDKLENWKSYILGIISLAGVLSGLIVYIYLMKYDTLKVNVDNINTRLDKDEQIIAAP